MAVETTCSARGPPGRQRYPSSGEIAISRQNLDHAGASPRADDPPGTATRHGGCFDASIEVSNAFGPANCLVPLAQVLTCV